MQRRLVAKPAGRGGVFHRRQRERGSDMATFMLHESHAREWLTRVVVINELGECGPDSQMDTDPPPITMTWQPRAVGEEDGTFLLVRAAQEAGALHGPPGVELDFEYVDDGDGGYYRYILRLADPRPLLLASPPEEMARLGEPDAIGLNAAMAILAEAVETANQLLTDLAAYVAAVMP